MPRSNESTIRDPERARELVALRPRETISCEMCGAERVVVVQSGGSRPRTCSARCRVALSVRERRKRAEQRAAV